MPAFYLRKTLFFLAVVYASFTKAQNNLPQLNDELAKKIAIKDTKFNAPYVDIDNGEMHLSAILACMDGSRTSRPVSPFTSHRKKNTMAISFNILHLSLIKFKNDEKYIL